ncbi:MAG: isochorismate synthase [Streptosporangiaceae bacterium]
MTQATAEAVADPLNGYLPQDSFFFRTPRRTLLTRGAFRTVPTCDSHDLGTTLPRRVQRTLAEAEAAGHPRPLVVGAIPFDERTPARLTVPGGVQWAGPSRAGSDPDGPPVSFGSIRHVPEPADYRRGVAVALEQLAAGELTKVVLARSLQLQDVRHADAVTLLRRLMRADPEAYVFAADLLGGRVLLGASPELLVQRSGGKVAAHPLAGSAPRQADPVADRLAGQALLASAKDQREHAVVVEAVAASLRQHCRDLSVPERPSLVQTGAMWHLGTKITGRLRDPEVSSLDLAITLHPTPAVCGLPQPLARQAIAEIERFDRGFYSGAVGWCDASGDGEWAITLRCAEVTAREIRLFAGAGIVTGSDPEGELAETSAKFRTFLRVLGIDQDL